MSDHRKLSAGRWANKYAELQIFKLKAQIGLLVFVWLVKSR